MSVFNKITDILLFREGTEEGTDGENLPVVTTGSIVWGVILRTAIVFIISFLLLSNFEYRQYWWIVLFLLWFVAAYPGWRQYQKFQQRIKNVGESTLCGSCKHFDKTGQLCKIFDEHITKEHIPCEGLNWEPKNFDTN